MTNIKPSAPAKPPMPIRSSIDASKDGLLKNSLINSYAPKLNANAGNNPAINEKNFKQYVLVHLNA